MSLTPYRKIDQSTWTRQDHYKYYTEKLKVNYSMTARLDVTRLRAECDRSVGCDTSELYDLPQRRSHIF